MRERTRARDQAEAQMAAAQRLWEACAKEESWEGWVAGYLNCIYYRLIFG